MYPEGSAEHPFGESVSYWQKTVPHTAYASELPTTCDVVVVGGGVLGAVTAYWLARSGAAVALLEQSAPAYGATGRNGGFVTVSMAEAYTDAITRLSHETAHAVLHLTLDNRALLRRVLAEEEIDCDYREPGHLTLALNEEQLAALKRTVEALVADGCPAILLDRAQVQSMVGTPLGPEIVGGKLLPGTAMVHSAKLVQRLIKAAQWHGVQICIAQVQQVTTHGEGVQVQTSQGNVQAKAAIIAVNAWTDQLIPMLQGLITPVRGQALAYAPLSPVFPMGMGAAVSTTGEYWQQTVDGSIVLGGCRAAAPGGDAGVREHQPTQEVQSALEQVFPRLFPALDGLKVVQRWAGLMAFTPDYLPIVDNVPGIDYAWVAGGFCGHGMPFVIKLGQLLAESALASVTSQELLPFRLSRPTLKSGTIHNER